MPIFSRADCSQILADTEKFKMAIDTQYDSCTAYMVKYCSHKVHQSLGFSPVNMGKARDGGWCPNDWNTCAEALRAVWFRGIVVLPVTGCVAPGG